MNEGNAALLLAQPDIDGGLIGGASLEGRLVHRSIVEGSLLNGMTCCDAGPRACAFPPASSSWTASAWPSRARQRHLAGLPRRCSTRCSPSAPMTRLAASGEAVGLPEGQMGNSEVGHLNIGAGRVVFQELTRINRACARRRSLREPGAVRRPSTRRTKPGAALHLMGLLSDGGVHSSQRAPLRARARGGERPGCRRVVRPLLHGRPRRAAASGAGYVAELVDVAGTSCANDRTCARRDRHRHRRGRYYAMDRDNRWERVEQAYDAVVLRPSRVRDRRAVAAMASLLRRGGHRRVRGAHGALTGARDAATATRSSSSTSAPTAPARSPAPWWTRRSPASSASAWPQRDFVCLTEYDPDDPGVRWPSPRSSPNNVLADVLADDGAAPVPHRRDGEVRPCDVLPERRPRGARRRGRSRALIPSPKVATYDLQPEMSEPEVADDAWPRPSKRTRPTCYIVNFANCDMVGHTGVIEAAVAAVEAVDAGVGQVLAAIERKGGVALVTADHGNADKMIAEDGGPFTAHTTNPVPLVLVDCERDRACSLSRSARARSGRHRAHAARG